MNYYIQGDRTCRTLILGLAKNAKAKRQKEVNYDLFP